uniref:Uncharacterized protein n=1 Tax=Leersia perrieri TaxID=77586 RepID=A0A0D9WDR1_9ORYZ
MDEISNSSLTGVEIEVRRSCKSRGEPHSLHNHTRTSDKEWRLGRLTWVLPRRRLAGNGISYGGGQQLGGSAAEGEAPGAGATVATALLGEGDGVGGAAVWWQRREKRERRALVACRPVVMGN